MTLENILLFLFLAIFFLNFQAIFGGVLLYFHELQEVKINLLPREELAKEIDEIIKPHELFLFAKGFKHVATLEYNNMFKKLGITQHAFCYYHEELSLHAFIDTTPMRGCLRSATVSFVTFYESYQMAISYDTFAHNVILPDTIYLFDHYHGSFESALASHLRDREISGEIIRREALSEEGYRDYHRYLNAETIEEMTHRDILKHVDGGYRFRANLAYLSYVYRSVTGYKRAKKILHSQPQIREEIHQKSEAVTLLTQSKKKPVETSREGKIRTFIISGVSFVLLFGLLGIPWDILPILIGVLLIHELGHYFAMRYFGYTDTSIFFIPLFGAAAKGEKEHTTPFEEYMVFLAGPLPGMILAVILGITLAIIPEFRTPLVKEYAVMSFVINYINLLPIFPLDGGKIVQTLLFSRYPKAQFYFFLLSLLVIILVALMLESIILGFFAVALLFVVETNYHISNLIEQVEQQDSQEPTLEKITKILSSDQQYQKLSLEKKSAISKQALKLLNTQKPTQRLSLVGMGIYLALLLIPIAMWMLLMGKI